MQVQIRKNPTELEVEDVVDDDRCGHAVPGRTRHRHLPVGKANLDQRTWELLCYSTPLVIRVAVC